MVVGGGCGGSAVVVHACVVMVYICTMMALVDVIVVINNKHMSRMIRFEMMHEN